VLCNSGLIDGDLIFLKYLEAEVNNLPARTVCSVKCGHGLYFNDVEAVEW